MRPIHTFMQARKKIAKTTTVPTRPKCIDAERARMAAPLVASGITVLSCVPASARPQ